MADGDVKFSTQRARLINLLDAHTTIGATNGVWAETADYLGGYIVATGLVGGDALNIDASNGDPAAGMGMPANTDHGAVLSAAVTSAAPTLAIAVLPRFIKAQVTAKAAGAAVTLSILCHGPR